MVFEPYKCNGALIKKKCERKLNTQIMCASWKKAKQTCLIQLKVIKDESYLE